MAADPRRSLVLLFLAAVLSGCGRSAAQPDSGRELVDLLVQDKAEPVAKVLMTRNGLPPAGDFRLKAPIDWGKGTPEEVGSVSSPVKIRSQGTTYVAMSVLADSPSAGAQALIFDEEGRLLRSFGGGGKDERQGSAQILSLGSPDTWFVMIDATRGGPTFEATSDVYLVGAGFHRLVRVWRHQNGVSFTRTKAEGGGQSFLEFFDPSGPGKGGGDGVDALGNKQPARIRWNPERRQFTGPKTVSFDGRPVYDVDLKESHGFEVIDIRR